MSRNKSFVVTAVVCQVVIGPAYGQELLWENFVALFGTAAANGHPEIYRSLLDDIWFEQPVIVSDYTMRIIWNSGASEIGERVNLTLWSDEGGEQGMGGQPGKPFFAAVALTYQEVPTGEKMFGRPLLDVHQQVAPFVIEPGVLWLEMQEVGPELSYQIMSEPTGSMGWVNYEDFGGLLSSQEIFNEAYGWDFQLFGFIPGEAAEGFIRIIDPVLFSGEPEGGVDDIREDDDSYYVLHAGQGIQVSRAHSARVIFETTLPDFPLDRMDLRVQSITTKPFIRQEISLFDFDANGWVILDNQPLPNTGPDLVVTIENLPEPERFINDSDGQTRLRVEAYSGPSISPIPHQLKVNKVNFVVTYTP